MAASERAEALRFRETFSGLNGRVDEAGRIKSIIDPRLADHVRREALKFADELNRAA